MFSSLASFLFGSSTNCESNSETKKEHHENLLKENQIEVQLGKDSSFTENRELDSKATINNFKNGSRKELRQKSKRNNKQNKNKQPAESPGEDFDLNEKDWFFVEEEDVGDSNPDSSFKRSSTPITDVLNISKPEPLQNQKIKNTSHQIRNCNRKKRNKTLGVNNRSFSTDSKKGVCNSSLSPSRSFTGKGANGAVEEKVLPDGDITKSLCIVPGTQESGHNVSSASSDSNVSGAKLFTMVDSWYLTPPPCFISNGPIHMEISPFENLLIEHPSMSVYHSIRSSPRSNESFVNLDLEMNESNKVQIKNNHVRRKSAYKKEKDEKENYKPLRSPKQKSLTSKSTALVGQNIQSTVEGRPSGPRVDRYTATQVKMELFAWNGQKCQLNRNNQDLRRSAILRSNQVREMQSKGNRQRRADLQHCRLISGVNNNRKCCY